MIETKRLPRIYKYACGECDAPNVVEAPRQICESCLHMDDEDYQRRDDDREDFHSDGF